MVRLRNEWRAVGKFSSYIYMYNFHPSSHSFFGILFFLRVVFFLLLDWWCWLDFKRRRRRWRRKLGRRGWWGSRRWRRTLLLFLLLAPYKVQCFGNLALWNWKGNHTAKSPKRWKSASYVVILWWVCDENPG